MSAQRASCFIHDPNSFALEIVDLDQEQYDGIDRRMDSRRKGTDRRIDVRFNITKQDRREAVGRRAEDVLPTFW